MAALSGTMEGGVGQVREESRPMRQQQIDEAAQQRERTDRDGQAEEETAQFNRSTVLLKLEQLEAETSKMQQHIRLARREANAWAIEAKERHNEVRAAKRKLDEADALAMTANSRQTELQHKLDGRTRKLQEARQQRQESDVKRQRMEQQVVELRYQVSEAQRPREEDEQCRLAEATAAEELLQSVLDCQSEERLEETERTLQEAKQELIECEVSRSRAVQQVIDLQQKAAAAKLEVDREKEEVTRLAKRRLADGLRRAKQAAQQRREIEKQLTEERTKVDVQRDRWQCKVCLVNGMSVMLEPCGHLSLCSTCATHLQLKLEARHLWKLSPDAELRCPICRQQTQSGKTVFVP